MNTKNFHLIKLLLRFHSISDQSLNESFRFHSANLVCCDTVIAVMVLQRHFAIVKLNKLWANPACLSIKMKTMRFEDGKEKKLYSSVVCAVMAGCVCGMESSRWKNKCFIAMMALFSNFFFYCNKTGDCIHTDNISCGRLMSWDDLILSFIVSTNGWNIQRWREDSTMFD